MARITAAHGAEKTPSPSPPVNPAGPHSMISSDRRTRDCEIVGLSASAFNRQGAATLRAGRSWKDLRVDDLGQNLEPHDDSGARAIEIRGSIDRVDTPGPYRASDRSIPREV